MARPTRSGRRADLLIATVQNLTGLTIDHFVQVDLLGFYRISNAIGGVQVKHVCAATTLRAQFDRPRRIDLHQGTNVVKGKQALAFVRQRYNFPDGNGDLDRVQRQRYFLTAAFRKLASAGVLLNPIKLQHLLTAVQSSLYLDDKLNPTDLARRWRTSRPTTSSAGPSPPTAARPATRASSS